MRLLKAGPVLCAPSSGALHSLLSSPSRGAAAPPVRQSSSPRGEQPGLFVIFKEGPGGIPGIFF